ncbi:MAG: class I SAM-dependent methyltransferase [Solirubrobacterales bacterium]
MRSKIGPSQPVEPEPDTRGVAPGNEQMAEAWAGAMFERFSAYRPIVAASGRGFSEAAFAAHPPAAGDRVLDVGCGWGETSRRLAELVGASGAVLGVDLSRRFVESARRESAEAGVENVRFQVMDAQHGDPGGPFDYAFSRFGIMFFADPVSALANLRRALRPGGRLVAVVWRRKPDNQWVHRAQLAVEAQLGPPAPSGTPTIDGAPAPGPYSMADADLFSDQLTAAGFERIAFERCDMPIRLGADLDAAVEFSMAMGPGGELIREAGERGERLRPAIAAEIRAALADLERPDGVWAPASTWLLSARAPRA